MARSGKKAVIETVGDKRVFTDGTQTVEIHNIKGLPHADGMLIAYIPSAKHRRLRRHVQPRGAGTAARAESARRRHAGIRRELGAARPRLGERHLGARAESRSADHAPRHSRDARPLERRDSNGAGRASGPALFMARRRIPARRGFAAPGSAGCSSCCGSSTGTDDHRGIGPAEEALGLLLRKRLEEAEPAIQAAARRLEHGNRIGRAEPCVARTALHLVGERAGARRAPSIRDRAGSRRLGRAPERTARDCRRRLSSSECCSSTGNAAARRSPPRRLEPTALASDKAAAPPSNAVRHLRVMAILPLVRA